VSAYSLGQLRSDLRMTLLMAGAYSFLALIGFGLLAASVLLGKRVDGGQAATVGSVLGALGVFVLVYITAAVGSAVVIFLLRPLRGRWFGWAISGALVSFVCYTSLLGLTEVFDSTLRWMQKSSTTGSSESHWGFMFMVIGVICVPIGAAFGVYWRDHPPDMR